MATLTWGDAGDRYYELGIDRGVLYVAGFDGVVWNGLTSVEEAPTGGEIRPFYYNGYKYLNVSAREEFEASIKAYSAPREFSRCNGEAIIANGLVATQQPRKEFGFSYRTLIGNDVDGTSHGYKIHVVYNAMAESSSRESASVSDSLDPIEYSWDIKTLPPLLTGYRPTAHMLIDSRYTPAALLKTVEDILYGTSSSEARLPSPSELYDLFTS